VDLRNYEFFAPGSAVIGANVFVYDASLAHPNPNSPLASTTTDGNGMWAFTGLTSSPKDVKVSYNNRDKWYKGLVRVGISASSGGIGKLQLAYVAATDIANAVALTNGGWTDIGTNQSFTVDDANSIILISVRGHIQAGAAASAAVIGSRIMLDSAGASQTFGLGGATHAASATINALAGSSTVPVAGLAVGTHTVKVQLSANIAGESAWCRAATNPGEILGISVMEVRG
jgi:hypothetical protein